MNKRLIFLVIVFLFITFFTVSFFLFRAPSDFPVGYMYTIEKGSGLNLLAENLAEKKVIRSAFWFKAFSVLLAGPKGIMAGDYVLNSNENVFSLAMRMTSGDYRLAQVKITIPEGYNISEIASEVSKNLPKIKINDFIEKSKNLEGYLFPDTYMFEINTDSDTVIRAMQSNYREKILDLSNLIKISGRSESDIIKMASILEEEARTTETRQIVAGILWRRLSLGMPLQVDASFKYINGKGTKDLTLDDLKINSPYNSYLYKGLPPTPICNPGLDSIKAALTPIKTAYLYFLTDSNGNMHYAKTYAEHLVNKQNFLK